MKGVLALFLIGTLLNHVTCQLMETKTCSRGAGHETIIQPDAQAFIAGFFTMHTTVEGSAFGCGDIYSGGKLHLNSDLENLITVVILQGHSEFRH